MDVFLFNIRKLILLHILASIYCIVIIFQYVMIIE